MEPETIKRGDSRNSRPGSRLKYITHFLKARGRHGTHSPFVYAFVEAVLRNRSTPVIRAAEVKALPPLNLNQKEITLLFRILQFLKPDMILLPDNRYEDWQRVLSLAGSEVEAIPYSAVQSRFYSGKALMLTDADGLHFYNDDITAFLNRPGGQLLYLGPNRRGLSKKNWDALCTIAKITCSLDLWYYGWLTNDNAFKARQHFHLR